MLAWHVIHTMLKIPVKFNATIKQSKLLYLRIITTVFTLEVAYIPINIAHETIFLWF